jgi:hypothetical protein
MSAGNGDEPYYVFKVRAWMMLDKPIAAQDEGLYIPKYTNKFLLEHCTHSYELFNIRSEEEFRLMQEMKRIFDDLEIEGGDAAPVYRPDDKHSIFVKDGSFVVLGEDGRTLMTMIASDFKRRPGRGFGKLAECLRKNKDGMRR